VGSRYDVNVFRDTTLSQFLLAFDGAAVLGAPVPAPWTGPSGVTIAEIDTAVGRHVVVAASPMKSPRGVDTRLAKRLGTEALFATVWDSVSVYSLQVVGDGTNRYVAADPEDGGQRERGARLPEEPSWPDLDEAYVQTVFKGRCGFDPGATQDYRATWFSFGPPTS